MLVRSKEAARNVLDWLKKQEIVFYDIETSSLSADTGVVIGFGVSNYTHGYYFPLWQYNADKNCLEIIEGANEIAIQALQALKGKKICAFNGAFDLPFTKQNLGIDLLPDYYCDVLLLKHTIDEEYPFKLKEIAVQVFGYGAASEQRDLQAELKALGAEKSEIYKASVATIGKYCVQDCLLTARLFRHYSAKLAEEKLEKFFYVDEVMPLYKEVTIPMEQYGIRLDLPLMKQSLAEISADLEAIETKIQQEIEPLLHKVFYGWFLNKDYPPARSGNFAQGICEYFGLDLPKTAAGKYSLAKKHLENLPDSHAKQVLSQQEYLLPEEVVAIQRLLAAKDHGSKSLFNLQSKHHLKKLFFDTLGLKPLSTTDLGNPQVDDDFIHSIATQYPWAADLHVYNRLQKIKSTYIERFLEAQQDGIFYPSFFQHRTVSGRLSGDFQQLPRPVEEGLEHELVVKYLNRIRAFFISRPNKVFVDADYNSAEPRVFAYISGDENLKNIFKNNYDFYSEIAIRTEKLQGVSSFKKADNYLGKLNPAKRQQAKAYALGTPYGLTGYKLAFQLECSTEEGDKLIEDYLNAFPKLKEWMQTTKESVVKTGYIRTLGGRIRHLPRALEIYKKHGLSILDPLELYDTYSDQPLLYEQMKKIRKEFKNYVNNANNVQIQATVASIINRASIAISRQFTQQNLDAHICAQIHDQLIVECDEAIKESVAKIVQTEMEFWATYFIKDLPIPAEPNFGYNLKESKGA